MIVEFFSAAISVSVPRNLSWRAWGFIDWDSALYRAEWQADTFEQSLIAGIGAQSIKPPVAFDINQKT